MKYFAPVLARLPVLGLAIACLALPSCGGAPSAASADGRLPAGAAASAETDQAFARPALASGPVRLVPQVGFGAEVEVEGMDRSADGRLVLADGRGGSLEVWDLESGLLVRTLHGLGSRSAPSLARFLPDGQRLLCIKGSALVTIDLGTGDVTGSWALSPLAATDSGPAAPRIKQLELSKDGRRALVALAQRTATTLVLWDVVQGKALTEWEAGGDIEAVRLSADGRNALGAISKAGGQALLWWDAEHGSVVRELTGHDAAVHALAIDLTGRLAATAGHDRSIVLWDLQTGTVTREIPRQAWTPAALAFSPSGAELASADEDGIYLWSALSGQKVRTFAGHHAGVRALAFSPDGCSLYSAGGRGPLQRWEVASGALRSRLQADRYGGVESIVMDGQHRVIVGSRNGFGLWDLEHGRLSSFFGGPQFRPRSLAISPDGARILVSGHAAQFYDLSSGREAQGFRAGTMGVEAVALSPDGRLVATAGIMDPAPLRLFDAASGAEVRRLGPEGARQQSLDGVAFGFDGKDLLSASRDGLRGVLSVWQVDGGALERSLAVLDAPVRVMAVSPRDHTVLVGARQLVRHWDYAQGKLLRELRLDADVHAVAFSADGQSALSAGDDARISLWDLGTGERRLELAAEDEPITAAAFSPDGRFVLAGTSGGLLRVHALAPSGRAELPPAVSLLSRGKEWLMVADDGTFDASRNGAELLAVVQGSRASRPDQLALALNRPDILLGRLGLGSDSFRAYLAGRHDRRLQKAGRQALAPWTLATNGLDVPEARLVKAEAQGKTATLELALGSAASELASYNVFVNGVALYGLEGKAVSGHVAKRVESIELSAGDNRLEVSAQNAAGLESLRAQTRLRYGGEVKRTLYFLGFGVSQYRDEHLRLDFAHQDALDLGAAFERLGSRMQVRTRVYTDAKVTADAIRHAKEFVSTAKVDDLFIVFIAGHGVHTDDPARTYYFLPWEADVAHVRETAVDFDLVEDLLLGIAPRNKLLLMDTCESGEDVADVALGVGSAGRGRGIHVARQSAEPKAPPIVFDRDRFLENDLRRRSGAVVFSSSRGNEPSFENADAGHGLFTKAILAALMPHVHLRDHLSVDELLQSVQGAVAAESSDQQHPTIDRDNPLAHFELPLAP